MKNLIIGLFHDEEIGKKLGKTGTESDIIMYNRKTDDCIYTFLHPVGDKITTKAQIMSVIDAAIISFAKMSPEVGETIVMLDSFGISKGVCTVPLQTDLSQITPYTTDTSIESFFVKNEDPHELFSVLEKFDPKRDTESPVVVTIDHAFSVKGVGEIMLGFVKKGTLKKHDKLVLYPTGKEVIVRSIQIQDKDFDSAEAGSRVGLAIKGVTTQEMKRGYCLAAEGTLKTGKKLKLGFAKNKYIQDEIKPGPYHLSVGMQTIIVNITDVSDGLRAFDSGKEIVYSDSDTFLLLDLNAPKLHVIGKGKIM